MLDTKRPGFIKIQPDTSPTPLMRPTQYVEHSLITTILNGTWPPGTALPAERTLAEQIGVTRPTLREALQRLARDRWITISHGKATIVNDYWKQGGMGILSALADYAEYLPGEFIGHLLEARILFLPACAEAAIAKTPKAFTEFLDKADALRNDAEAFAEYDWELQSMMAHSSGNLIFPLILNDFEPIFNIAGQQYFCLEVARIASAAYYAELYQAIRNGNKTARRIVKKAMAESLEIWNQLQQADER